MNKFEVKPTGSTGTEAGTAARDMETEARVAFLFAVEAVGATPTATYVWEGSLDGTNWKPIAYVTDASDTVAVTARTVTTVGVEILYLANPQARFYRYYRLRVTANTNVTYRAEAYTD